MLGVYPSALHVRWTAPSGYKGVRALAVAPEPWPFWDGDDQEERVAHWRDFVDWQDSWGQALSAGHVNGSSGRLVRERVLAPLGLLFEQVWLTDALPFFHVHRGPRTQGAAMSERYDPFVASHGLQGHGLPDRPSPAALVALAIHGEAGRLRDELRESRARLLVTLGSEALAVAASLVAGELPQGLAPDSAYGTRHVVTFDDGLLEVLPLVHPGQKGAVWVEAHERWVAQVQGR